MLTIKITEEKPAKIVETYNELDELQAILRRNYAGSGPLWNLGKLLHRLLDIAHTALQKDDIFEAEFKDGSRCCFITSGGKVDLMEAQGWKRGEES